jgi:hypothetical protein
MNIGKVGVALDVKTADATPYASSLIQSLRDIGYSCDTALADIIDNSITAKASRIEILTDLSQAEPAIAILDDGEGMCPDVLVEAMRPGSKNPLEKRDINDLGRFGLGLKSASFSQCKKLTVLTRRDGIFSGATWDLDRVAHTNRWEIELHDEQSVIPWRDRLTSDGTLVIWRSLDRIGGGLEGDEIAKARHINGLIAQAERHIRLVFHRFMSEGPAPLSIFLNGRRLDPIDPFGTSFPGHQVDRVDRVDLPLGTVEFQAHTLPHHSGLTKAQWDDLGGPEGHLRSQGFYIYRGRRLIIAGSWLGLARQLELTKLCRVRVDIPNTMDPDWKIDVKKASAQLPPKVRDRMRLLVERLPQASKRTYQRKGNKLVDEEYLPIWSRVRMNGGIVYRPNLTHPLMAAFSVKLPPELQNEFANIIAAIGTTMPIASLHADFAGSPEAVITEDSDEAMLQQYIRAVVPALLETGLAEDDILDQLQPIELLRKDWDMAEKIIRATMQEMLQP